MTWPLDKYSWSWYEKVQWGKANEWGHWESVQSMACVHLSSVSEVFKTSFSIKSQTKLLVPIALRNSNNVDRPSWAKSRTSAYLPTPASQFFHSLHWENWHNIYFSLEFVALVNHRLNRGHRVKDTNRTEFKTRLWQKELSYSDSSHSFRVSLQCLASSFDAFFIWQIFHISHQYELELKASRLTQPIYYILKETDLVGYRKQSEVWFRFGVYCLLLPMLTICQKDWLLFIHPSFFLVLRSE